MKIDTGSSKTEIVLAGKFRQGNDVVIDPNDADKIYVSHEGNVVKKYSLQSGSEVQLYQFARRIEGISVDPLGLHMVVAWHNEVQQVLLKNGWPIKTYSGFQGPTKPRIEPNGQCLTCSKAAIHVVKSRTHPSDTNLALHHTVKQISVAISGARATTTCGNASNAGGWHYVAVLAATIVVAVVVPIIARC